MAMAPTAGPAAPEMALAGLGVMAVGGTFAWHGTATMQQGINGIAHAMGEAGQGASGGSKGSVWSMKPTERGAAIESQLAKTDYADWFHVGAEQRGYFPLVDFQKGDTLVSLKTVDTTGSTWMQRMERHIEDMGRRGASVNRAPATMVLDLRVQPGGLNAARALESHGGEWSVIVRISEYP